MSQVFLYRTDWGLVWREVACNSHGFARASEIIFMGVASNAPPARAGTPAPCCLDMLLGRGFILLHPGLKRPTSQSLRRGWLFGVTYHNMRGAIASATAAWAILLDRSAVARKRPKSRARAGTPASQCGTGVLARQIAENGLEISQFSSGAASWAAL